MLGETLHVHGYSQQDTMVHGAQVTVIGLATHDLLMWVVLISSTTWT